MEAGEWNSVEGKNGKADEWEIKMMETDSGGAWYKNKKLEWNGMKKVQAWDSGGETGRDKERGIE